MLGLKLNHVSKRGLREWAVIKYLTVDLLQSCSFITQYAFYGSIAIVSSP